jgi:hypothetical protein
MAPGDPSVRSVVYLRRGSLSANGSNKPAQKVSRFETRCVRRGWLSLNAAQEESNRRTPVKSNQVVIGEMRDRDTYPVTTTAFDENIKWATSF